MGIAMSPGAQGGTNWPGGAYDPETHLLYVYSKTTAQVSSLVKPAPGVSDMNYITGRAGQTPTTARPMGARSAGEGGRSVYVMVDGLPLLKPPYGILTAIKLDRGDLAWKIAHGETPDSVRNNPALKGLTIPRTGQSGNIGPLCTKTLVIIGDPEVATTPSGERGAPLRAYEKSTGKELGAVFMPAPQSGSPMTYMWNGKQYIAVAISGGNYPAELVAFKLPAGGQTPQRVSATAAPRPAAAVGPNTPLYTAAQAARGRALYGQQCAVCHGVDLEGVEMAPSLAGGAFVDRWTGQSLGDLFERIRTTMPRGKPGSLSREANADITAYILSANRFEAGSSELYPDVPALRRILIGPPGRH
jgi:mono/diheme cytochrome c family protein